LTIDELITKQKEHEWFMDQIKKRKGGRQE